MLKILLIYFLLQTIHCCPSGFDVVINGLCGGNYTKLSTYYDNAVNDAVETCGKIAGQPIIIHSEEENAYWSSQVAGNGAWTFIGIVCNSKRFHWVDGSPLDYEPLHHNGELDRDCVTGDFVVLRSDGLWGIYGPEHSAWTTDLFCTVQHRPPSSPDHCIAFADDVEDGLCYQVGAAAANWQDAQLICSKLGANLASIHNAQENSFLRRLGVSNGAVNGLFLGVTIIGKSGSFGWIDGTAWDYENFAPGFPRNDFGDCMAMDTTTTAGGWMNINCTKQLPVACVREKGTGADPVCSTKTWAEEGKLITSPGFPYSASLPCDFFLEVENGKNVEVKILLLEANACCDSLVIYDGYLGASVLATLTGSVSNMTFTTTDSNIMRVSWLPTNGVNVMGVAMAFRGV